MALGTVGRPRRIALKGSLIIERQQRPCRCSGQRLEGRTGELRSLALAEQAKQQATGSKGRQNAQREDNNVRLLLVQGVRVGRPGLMGSSGGQTREQGGKAKTSLHAAMVWAEPEKSSLGIEGEGRSDGVMDLWSDGVVE